jgi:hypothetical protein
LRDAVSKGDREAFTQAAGVSADTPVAGKPFFDLVAEYLMPYQNAPKKVVKKKVPAPVEGVAEGAPIVVMPRADRLKKADPPKQRYMGDIVPPTKPPSTEKRGVKGRPGQRPMPDQGVAENFADGKNPQDKGDSKRHGINTKASVSSLRKTAKQGGRKGQLAHWLANMKAGRAKKEDVVEASGKRCPQCGSTNCSCDPSKCKCKPVAGWVPGKGFQKAVAEAEAKYDANYQDTVKRVGQMAKEGPRKTVWDPVKRVYKTVPVNPQKKTEDAAGVGIITKQNSTPDVNKGTPRKNLKAFKLVK